MEKVAVIDLGGNSIKLTLAHVLESEHFVIFDELKEGINLGYEVNSEGFLKQSKVAKVIDILKMFKKMCESHQVDKIYAIATSAVRRAKNQKSFLEEVSSTCGYKLKIISESEEASYIYNGVVNGFDIQKGLIVNVSSSNIQFIKFNRKGIVDFENLRFGPISLLEKFSDTQKSALDLSNEIESHVKEELQKIEFLKHLDNDTVFVGVGNTFKSLTKIHTRIKKYALDYTHNYILEREDISNVYEMIKSIDADKRTKIKGLSGRADIFCASIACLKSIIDCANINSITVSDNGLRDGLMFNHAVPITLEKPLYDVLGHSIYTKLNYLGENIVHAEQVYGLTIQLYKQLRVLHKLPRFYTKVLRIAALMHECGLNIKFADFHQHSFYYILNCGLQGATHREIILAGFTVIAYKQDEIPKQEWQKYKGIILDEDLLAVYKLSVLLRIADSLDIAMVNGIKGISCDILGDSVIMKTVQDGDCNLEILDAHNSADEQFARAYKKNLKIL